MNVHIDMAKIRVAPLSWMFPLAFAPHAAAPGCVLFGLSLGGVIPTPWSYLGMGVGVPLAIVGAWYLVRMGLRIRARLATMREAERVGHHAQATIVSSETLFGGFRRSGGAYPVAGKKARIRLHVQPPNAAQYQTTQELYFLHKEFSQLRAGAKISVRIHPRAPQVVFVPPLSPPAQQQPQGSRETAVGMYT